MHRSRGGMASPAFSMLLLATLSCYVSVCKAGPVGPLPNVTSSDVGLREGSCAVGDVVYMAGDEFPGSGPCERCSCSASGVLCAKQRCEPRPGCKALHRPDHCCPTYQCECEQEGRVYGNGEKLVDPNDPCRVCYCQGGEVVCRRIACFVRDDCRPRLVPGRCCPEYDNCPLRGITTIPGVAPSVSSVAAIEDVGASAQPAVPKENIKQEITIKEITPVSEIPVITDVKIKEILPSPSIEVAEYSSSKSPLIPREATSEKPSNIEVDLFPSSETPGVVEVKSSSLPVIISSLSPETTKTKDSFVNIKSTQESFPSKISFSTQESTTSEIHPSNVPSVALMGSPSVIPAVATVVSTTKAPIVEEEDTSLFEHNPAFPPLPDDLSVLSNHEDEIVPESNMDNEHVSSVHEIVNEASSTQAPVKELLITTSKDIPETTPISTTKLLEISTDVGSTKFTTTTTEPTIVKGSPMLNLRSAIPTEILTVASTIPEDINGELDDISETTVSEGSMPIITSTTTENAIKLEEKHSVRAESQVEDKITSVPPFTTEDYTKDLSTTQKAIKSTESSVSSQSPQDQTTSSIIKSNVATEITSQTEISSLPVETSDQNPRESSISVPKDNIPTTTAESTTSEVTDSKIVSTDSEKIPKSRTTTVETIPSFDSIETTEFIFTSFGSAETTTDTVELIKTSDDSEKNAAIIEPVNQKNSVLTDLINLVGDVASISDHTDEPDIHRSTLSSGISESEELIPVNAGYKSKNNNWNVNSITEVPQKSKNQSGNKQKIVEIEDDDSSITDSPSPNNKVEPTTRRPIIDNVSDVMPVNKTDKKDIEIITQSYVPTISKRPTKVVMKKDNDKIASEETSTDDASVSVSSKVATEFTPTVSGLSAAAVSQSAESDERIAESAGAGAGAQ